MPVDGLDAGVAGGSAARTAAPCQTLKLLLAACLLVLIGPLGCDTAIPGMPGAGFVIGVSPELGGSWVVEESIWDHEENDTFDTAQQTPVNPLAAIELVGSVHSVDDVDVFSLGAVSVGETVAVVAQNEERGMSAIKVAIFDGDGLLLQMAAVQANAFFTVRADLSFQLRYSTQEVFVCVAAGAIKQDGTSVEFDHEVPYRLVAHRGPGSDLMAPPMQVVWLDFDGGAAVGLANPFPREVPPFSAQRLSPDLAGEDHQIMELIIQHLEKDFANHQIVFYSSHRDQPLGVPHSTIYFGGEDRAFLGLAENTDGENRDIEQDAIVFAEDLSTFDFLGLSAESVAQGLASVAAHELGHLIGMRHTSGPGDIMSVWNHVLDILTVDARFTVAPLAREVFPIGAQDAPRILDDALGRAGNP